MDVKDETMSEKERTERIRRKAYELWEEEGQPAGREGIHWDQATELVAIEENHALARAPLNKEAEGRSGEPAERPGAVSNLGEFPTLTDQGEQTYPPQLEALQAPAKPRTQKAAGPRAQSGMKRPVSSKSGERPPKTH